MNLENSVNVRSSHRRGSIKKLDEMGSDIIMLHIYLFHFGIVIFVFYPEVVEWRCSLKTCPRVSFLSATSNFINEETLAQFFPKPLTIFTKSFIVDFRLGYKYASVLPLDLKPSCKDFLLWKSVIKIATVLYYYHRFTIHRDKIEQQSNTRSVIESNSRNCNFWEALIAFAIGLLKYGIRFSYATKCEFLAVFRLQKHLLVGVLQNRCS